MFSCDDLRQIYGIEEDDEDIYVDDRILTVVNTASRLLRLLHSACRTLGVSFEDSVWPKQGNDGRLGRVSKVSHYARYSRS